MDTDGDGAIDIPSHPIGRSQDLHTLEVRAQMARDGARQVVVVEGAAGMGKTTLVRSFVRQIPPEEPATTVVAVACDEAEQGVAFGLIGLLAAALGAPVERWSAGAMADPFLAGREVLALLSGRPSPLVLTIDDAQWADSASVTALSFALRRLPHDPLLVILTVRRPGIDGHLDPVYGLAETDGAVITLAGLGVDDLRALAEEVGVRAMPEWSLARLRDHTEGNPLFARMLLADPEALRDPRDVVPAPSKQFERMVADRIDRLDATARALVVAASVLGVGAALNSVVAVADLQVPGTDIAAALDAAAAAGLLESRDVAGGRQVAFSHPIIRGAAYHHTPIARRSELHRRAADLVRPEQPRAALRHEVQATTGPDAATAARAEAAAAEDEQAASWESAGAWWLTAAQLHDDRAGREADVLRSALCLLAGGDIAAADALVADTEHFEETAMLLFLRGRLASLSGNVSGGTALLLEAWERRGDDHEVASLAASHLSGVSVASGTGADAARWALQAIELGEHGAGRLDVDPLSRYLIAKGLSGEVAEGLAFAAEHADRFGDPATGRVDGLLGRGVLRIASGDVVAAEAEIGLVTEVSGRFGPFHLWCYAQAWRSAAAYQCGHWDDAIRWALEATNAADTEAWSFGTIGFCALAVPLVGRGDREGAQAAIDQAKVVAARAGAPVLGLVIGSVEAWAAHVSGAHERAVEMCEPWLEVPALGLDVVSAPPPVRVYGLACLRLDRFDDVRRAADLLDQQLNPTGPAWAATFRAAALLNEGSDVTAAHALAIEKIEQVSAPFERALLLLKLGQQVRRTGQRKVALGYIRDAEQVFRRVGAAPFLARAETEQDMSGLRPSTETHGRQSLTATEQILVDLVRRGLTNRQIAAELLLSVKTVEYHLTNTYRKVGVSSRTSLLAALED